MAEHVFPEPETEGSRRKWLWRAAGLLGLIVSLYLVLGPGYQAFAGGVGASLAVLLLSFFRPGSFQRPELKIDTDSRYLQFGYRYYPVDSLRQIRLIRFPDGTAALRLKADRMRELRVPAREDMESAVAILRELNPAIRVLDRSAIVAARRGRRRRFQTRSERPSSNL
jgi:hypothetical protein